MKISRRAYPLSAESLTANIPFPTPSRVPFFDNVDDGLAERRRFERNTNMTHEFVSLLPRMAVDTPGMSLNDSVYEQLLRSRIVFLGSEVEDEIANRITAQLLLLAADDPVQDIKFYINSPGGSVNAGMAI